MDFVVEVRDGDGSENIIHRTSCIIVSDKLYPLGVFATYDSALLGARQMGYVNLNGCYWCCYWNHSSTSPEEIDSAGIQR